MGGSTYGSHGIRRDELTSTEGAYIKQQGITGNKKKSFVDFFFIFFLLILTNYILLILLCDEISITITSNTIG